MTDSDMNTDNERTAQTLILEMVAGGATKAAIAKAVGVTDMTIMSVFQGKTKVFRKLKKLQSVYDRWKARKLDLSGKRGKRAGKLDLSGKRGKKAVEPPVEVEALAETTAAPATKASAGTTIQAKRWKTTQKPVPTVKAKRGGRPPRAAAVIDPSEFQIPDVTEEMVAGVEEQIRRLKAQAKYMKDLIALRKKYGQE